VLLMIVGVICAFLHGAALPVLLLVFGDMTDSFVNAGMNSP
jgi:ATP-binding cassette subfamily B (MDR/TAP) protein 1